MGQGFHNSITNYSGFWFLHINFENVNADYILCHVSNGNLVGKVD